MGEKWIDRYFYTLDHPEVQKSDKLSVGFCPEGMYKTGDVIRDGAWTKTVVKVETRYKQANEYLQQRWAGLWPQEKLQED